MIKNFVMSLTLVFSCSIVEAQFFYNDIVSNRQVRNEHALFKENNIKKVTIRSFDAEGSKIEDMLVTKTISKDYLQTITTTKSLVSDPSVSISVFNKEGLITSYTDSSEFVNNKIFYEYDEDNRLLKTISEITSFDEDYITVIKEEHVYVYTEDFYPDKMYQIKNGKDTTMILFSKDEVGNISIEKDTKTGRKFFYYYDEKSRLTDIVHAHEYTEKLLPDYVFTYNEDGLLTEAIHVESNNSYNIWSYTYNDKKLKTSDKFYDKKRRLIGSVTYHYN